MCVNRVNIHLIEDPKLTILVLRACGVTSMLVKFNNELWQTCFLWSVNTFCDSWHIKDTQYLSSYYRTAIFYSVTKTKSTVLNSDAVSFVEVTFCKYNICHYLTNAPADYFTWKRRKWIGGRSTTINVVATVQTAAKCGMTLGPILSLYDVKWITYYYNTHT